MDSVHDGILLRRVSDRLRHRILLRRVEKLMKNYDLRLAIDRSRKKLERLNLQLEIDDIDKQLEALRSFQQWYPPRVPPSATP